MPRSKEKHLNSILLKQTDQLYSRLVYSAIGTVITACLIAWIVGSKSNPVIAWKWFALILLLSLLRWTTAVIYVRLPDTQRSDPRWHRRFKWLAWIIAVVWSLPMWLFYPENPAYQVLTIMALAGIAGASMAILSYDRNILTGFLLILLVGALSRLISLGDPLSLELAALVFFYILFMIKGGRDIGSSFMELLALRQSAEEHNLTLLSITEEVARIGYWQWDMSSPKIEFSSNLRKMCGVSRDQLDIDQYLEHVHPDDRSRVQMSIDSARLTGQEVTVEYRQRNPHGKDWMLMNQVIKRVDESSGNQFLLGMVQDVSILRKAEQKIFDMAYYDELTGLANRGHFREHLKEKVKHARRRQTRFALLYIDLDGFKQINDMMGHEKGDVFLRHFSSNLKQAVREADFIARLGGDEFCVLLGDIQGSMDCVPTAQRCLELRDVPIVIDNHSIYPQMSIGIAVYPQDGADDDSLLKAADAAMYAAKQGGKHNYAFYDNEMTERAARRVRLEADLQRALKEEEFFLVYQPKVDLYSNELKGVEALIRWRHPERGLVPPDEFIATAERIGLIRELGEWVLDRACSQHREWKQQGVNLQMAVNIASNHFSSAHFVDRVRETLQRHGVAEGELEVEITESMTRDPQQHLKVCRELRRCGVRVAIDDFGTGYSSLSVLKQLQVDTLKVDKSFIQHLPGDRSSTLMVRAIVDMALGLGFDVVAEGVEDEAQADFLRQLGCPYAQGFYFSRPVEADKIPAMMGKLFVGDETIVMASVGKPQRR